MEKEPDFRYSTLEERKRFYEKEFSFKKVKEWFKLHNLPLPQLCAIDAGTESKILLNKKWDNSLFYFPFDKLKQKIKKYLPEDIYYDRNKYENPKKTLSKLSLNKWETQEFVFDLDADNIKCKCKNNRGVCNNCLNKLYKSSLKLKKKLKNNGFKNVLIVYSGRGFHIHVIDKKAFSFNIKDRENFNKKFSNFPIDPWVSRGYIRLIRMPYTLHGLISRKCIPIETKFKLKETMPKFLKN